MSFEPHEPPPSKADTIAQTLRRLRGASALVDRAVARALEPHGLTTAQYEVLKVMAQAEDEALGCSELGKRLAGPSPDVTRLLNRLETVLLVSRIRDENDRRVVHTKITEKGREVLSLASPAVQNAEARALTGLADGDREQLARLLASLQLNLAGN
jgi:DNA-binding MarR family transcriptional regulator